MPDKSQQMLDNASNRPLVTFALFAFNQEQFIREAVKGAFSQTYEPLEIILSDDCSSDRTFEIIEELAHTYEGPHDVRVRRNRVNLGLSGHVNAVMASSRGDIIVLAAGDDISLSDRACVSVDLLNRHPLATAVLLSADVIDHSGTILRERILTNKGSLEETQTIDHLLSWQHITFGATRGVRREVFSTFGPISDDCPTEDTPLLIRSLLLGTNIISGHKAALYRKHNKNLSAFDSMKRMNISAIYNQYSDDIDIAEKGGLISSDRLERIRLWTAEDYRLRAIKLGLGIKNSCTISNAVFIANHASLTVQGKLRLIVKLLLRPTFWG